MEPIHAKPLELSCWGASYAPSLELPRAGARATGLLLPVEAERRTGAFCRLFLSRLFARGFEVSEVQKNVRGASERFGGKRLGYTSLCGYSSPSPYSTLNEGAREFSIYSPRRVSVI